VLRSACLAVVLGLVLCTVRDARAVGAVLSPGHDRANVVQARYAMTTSPWQTTRWASLRVERFPGAMAWLLPVRRGARVDEVTDAWFEALELASAPRIVPPVCDASASKLRTRVEGPTTLTPSVRALDVALLDDPAALRAFAASWGFELPAAVDNRFRTLSERGFRLIALVYGGAADREFTRTVRITDDAFPAVPLFMTLGIDEPIDITAFLMGADRYRVGKGSEIELDPDRILFLRDGSTNYATMLGERLADARGESWVLETAGHRLLFEGMWGPSGTDPSPPLVTTYLARAAAYGDTDGYPSCVTAIQRLAAMTGRVGRACAAGSLATVQGSGGECSESTAPDEIAAGVLRCGPAAADLALALSGLELSTTWLTRVRGIVPAHEFGDDLAATTDPGPPKSPFLLATHSEIGCSSTSSPDGGSSGPTPVPPGLAPPVAPPNPTVVPDPTGMIVDPGEPATEGLSLSCSCSPAAPESAESNDSCDRSDSSSSGSDEGCDGAPEDDSNTDEEGCDSSDSGSSSDADDGCDGDSGSSDDGCDTSSGSSSSSESKCNVPRRSRRGRSRTSLVTLAFAAILLPLRRLGRRRRAADQP